jgi:hypothetical protein
MAHSPIDELFGDGVSLDIDTKTLSIDLDDFQIENPRHFKAAYRIATALLNRWSKNTGENAYGRDSGLEVESPMQSLIYQEDGTIYRRYTFHCHVYVPENAPPLPDPNQVI